MIVKSKHTSCHGCKLNRNDYCYWFNRPKQIPFDIMNKAPSIVASIIDIFDGEFIGTPVEKRTYSKSKEWWKEKSKHKYGERKDW